MPDREDPVEHARRHGLRDVARGPGRSRADELLAGPEEHRRSADDPRVAAAARELLRELDTQPDE